MNIRRSVGVTAGAAVAMAALAAAPAYAAPDYTPNPAGYGQSVQTGDCNGQPTTIITNANASENGWGAARIVGTHDVFVPTEFDFSLVDLTTGAVIWQQAVVKGSGQQQGTVACTFPTEDAGATLGDLVQAGLVPAGSIPADQLGDEAGFGFTAQAIQHGASV